VDGTGVSSGIRLERHREIPSNSGIGSGRSGESKDPSSSNLCVQFLGRGREVGLGTTGSNSIKETVRLGLGCEVGDIAGKCRDAFFGNFISTSTCWGGLGRKVGNARDVLQVLGRETNGNSSRSGRSRDLVHRANDFICIFSRRGSNIRVNRWVGRGIRNLWSHAGRRGRIFTNGGCSNGLRVHFFGGGTCASTTSGRRRLGLVLHSSGASILQGSISELVDIGGKRLVGRKCGGSSSLGLVKRGQGGGWKGVVVAASLQLRSTPLAVVTAAVVLAGGVKARASISAPSTFSFAIPGSLSPSPLATEVAAASSIASADLALVRRGLDRVRAAEALVADKRELGALQEGQVGMVTGRKLV